LWSALSRRMLPTAARALSTCACGARGSVPSRRARRVLFARAPGMLIRLTECTGSNPRSWRGRPRACARRRRRR
jgi:hypothetical protein